MSDSKFVLKDRKTERYIYSFSVHGIDFVKRQKYAKSYKTFDEAEYAKMRIRKYDETLHLTVEEVEIPRCNMDCFNCPLEDCTSARARTKWEKTVFASVLNE